MNVLDRAFGVALLAFCIGAAMGASAALVAGFREFVTSILQLRVMAPMQTVSGFGIVAVFLLVFLNNSIAAVLSFLYPLTLAKIHWTPRMSSERMRFFAGAFTVVASFLIGFFNLGAVLGVVWFYQGEGAVLSLLSSAWVHGPLEFGSVLICVAEPLRTARATTNQNQMISRLSGDLRILWVVLFILLISAALEVFIGL